MGNKTPLFTKIQAILFLVFLATAFFFNRFAIDDFYFIHQLNDVGFWQAYKDLFIHWHGRWSSNLLLLGFMSAKDFSGFLIAFNVVSVGLLFMALLRAAVSLNNQLKLGLEKKEQAWYALVFLTVFFFSNPNPNETWFWYTGSVVYLWSIIAAVAAISAWLSPNLTTFEWMIYALSLWYIGGANEPLTIFLFIGFIVLILRNIRRVASSIGFGLLLVSFMVNYWSPGTMHRDAITPSLSVVDTILYSGYAATKYLFFEFHKSYQIALLMALPFYLLGKRLTIHLKFNPLKAISFGVLIIGAATVINALIGVVALGGLPPDRSMITSSLIISIVIAWIALGLGNRSKSSNKVINFAPAWGCLYLLVFTIYFYGVHQSYAKAYDERIETAQSSAADKILLDPLPDAGYFYSAEITADPNHYKNQHLKNGLRLKNDVTVVIDTTSLK